MEPVQQPQLIRNRQIRRDKIARRTISSRSITEYDKWVEGIKSSGDQFGKHPSPGAWSSRIITNSKSLPCDRDEEFHLHDKPENPDVDRAGSPVLWEKSLADQRSYMLHNDENAHPALRSQKVSDYRKEMMEMIRGLPEEDFELTLQDIVEKRKESKHEEPVIVKEPKQEDKETKRKKHQKKCESVMRSNSIDTGLLTRMFLPLSVAVRRRSLTLQRRGEKVTTKDVEPRKKSIERKKSKDEEWWRKNEFSEKGSSNSSSVGSSSSNGSNSTGDDQFSRNMSMRQTKCYCFRPGKSKAKSR